jgi:hypothetical protein
MTNSFEGAELPDILDSHDLERLTRTPASTWRFWATSGQGPASFKIGRRRVWAKAVVLRWLAEQEQAASSTDCHQAGDESRRPNTRPPRHHRQLVRPTTNNSDPPARQRIPRHQAPTPKGNNTND